MKFSISSRKKKRFSTAPRRSHLKLYVANFNLVVPRTPMVSKSTSLELKVCFFPGALAVNFINSSWTFACSYLFERSNRCEHAKGNMQKTGNFHLKKTEKNNKIWAITLRLQVIEIYSHQLLKYNWTDFSSKQRSFYFTKPSRWPDPTTQRAGFGPRAVCLTPLVYGVILEPWSNPIPPLNLLIEHAKFVSMNLFLVCRDRSLSAY